jgi:hypothetical protein
MVAVIDGLASQLGELVSIESLVGDGISAEMADQLTARGQKMCSVAPSELPLIETSVRRSLAAAGIEPQAVDRILVTSESVLVAGSKPAHEALRARLYGLFAGLGLGGAPVLMFTFAGCGSVVAALEYAVLLVDAGSAENVLVVAADRVLEGGERVLPPAVSVVGDGVASCLVRRAAPESTGWLLREVRRRAFLEVAEFDRATDFGPALVMLGRALVSLAREQGARNGAWADAVLACNNYGMPTLRLFARTLGMTEDRLFTGNVAAVGHLGSPDPLVNLESLAGRGRPVALLATGPADCAYGLLEPYGGGHAGADRDAREG